MCSSSLYNILRWRFCIHVFPIHTNTHIHMVRVTNDSHTVIFGYSRTYTDKLTLIIRYNRAALIVWWRLIYVKYFFKFIFCSIALRWVYVYVSCTRPSPPPTQPSTMRNMCLCMLCPWAEVVEVFSQWHTRPLTFHVQCHQSGDEEGRHNSSTGSHKHLDRPRLHGPSWNRRYTYNFSKIVSVIIRSSHYFDIKWDN